MTNQPLFSIITVTLNPGEGLGRTVDSVKTQKFRDFEHIVKDAGSTDGSVAQYVRRGLNCDPILIIRPDRGIYDAMNQGMDHANGKYVLFLNSGDLLFSNEVLDHVAKVVTDEPDLGLVYGDYYSVEFCSFVRSPTRLSKRLLFRNMLCHQACFIKRSVLAECGGFDASFRLLGDYDMLASVLISRALPYQHVNCVVSMYQGGGVTRTQSGLQEGRREMERIRDHYFTRAERFCFRTAYAFTLPGLRNWLMNSPRCKRLWPLYVRLANVYNRVSSGRPYPQKQ